MKKPTNRCWMALLLFFGSVLFVFGYLGNLFIITQTYNYPKSVPDISYNPTTKTALVVWEQYDPYGEDEDVYGRIIDLSGNPVTNNFPISDTKDYRERNPKVACSNSASWVVVWSSKNVAVNIIPAIRLCKVDSDGSISNIQSVAENLEHDLGNPDIGGSTTNGNYLVVWEEENRLVQYEVRGARYDAENDNFPAYNLTIANVPFLGSDKKRPSVSQRCSDYFVGWEKHHGSQVDIEAITVPYDVPDSTTLGDPIDIISDGSRNTDPSVTKGTFNNEYCVVCQHIEGDGKSRIVFRTDMMSKCNFVSTSFYDIEWGPSVARSGWGGIGGYTYTRYFVSYMKSPDGVTNWSLMGTIKPGDGSRDVDEKYETIAEGQANSELTSVYGYMSRALVVWDAADAYDTKIYGKDWYAPSLCADVNRDGLVNMIDLVMVCICFGAERGGETYNPAVDCKTDGEIDIYDVVYVAARVN